ncbi:alginate export family protein [Pseudomonas boanensis]|uniref:alginate export family protein n=1 Tax=Metapseudomonas boanensis TaxID=2822138 RepID=UPI0035D4B8C6
MRLHLKQSVVAFPVLLALASGANAFEEFKVSELSFTPKLELGAGYVYNSDQAFGSDVSFFGLPVNRDSSRFEYFAKPGLDFSGPLGGFGSFYGGVSAVASFTRGDSDGAGFTRDDPESSDVDEAYLGWKSGSVFSSFGEDALKLSFGRQAFMVGNGFLIGEGHVDQGHDAGYWLGPYKAFDNTVLAQLDTGKLHVDLFDLQARMDLDVADIKEKVRVRGGNVEWRDESYGTVGFTGFHTLDADNPLRDGMNVYDVRASGSPIQALPQVALAAEYAWQRGGEADKTSEAWYVQGSYTFQDAPWTPVLMYRHAVFSDDYDSLLYGYGGDWGTWFHGEIVGESMLFNVNQKVDMLKLTGYPTETLMVGAILYDFSYDKAPEGVTSKDFAKELNLHVDWLVTPKVTVGALYGVARPEEGAKQTFGDDETSHLFETYINIKF